MGRRTRKEPQVTDTFLWRICHALDEPPRMLAKNIGIEYKELKPLLGQRAAVVELEKDYVWWAVSDYVNKKLGYMLAIRSQLNKALQNDRVKRASRLEKFRSIHDQRNRKDNR